MPVSIYGDGSISGVSTLSTPLGIVTATTFSGDLTGNVSSSGVSTFSSGIVVSAGTTSAPSISPSGDSNTGIFFPSADNVVISGGGVEVLRVDSNGNIGIKTGDFNINSTLRTEYATTSPPKIMFDTAYSNAQTDSQLKLYIFNSGNTRQGFGAGPSYDLQYHCSGAAADQAKHRFYTDNVLRMAIEDSSGSVTKPTQPAFLAYNDSGVSVSGGWNNLSSSLTSETYDIGGNYGTSTAGRFVAPVAGRYLFYAGGWSTGNTTDARYAISAAVNGGSQFYISGGNYSLVDSPLSGYSIIHNLAVNDFVELFYYSAIATQWGGGSHPIYWGGYLLG